NNAFAHECLSNFLCAQGRFEEAIVEIKRAEALDPVSPRLILMSAFTYYQTRNYSKAVEKARKGNAMQENFPQGLLHLGNALTAAGDHDEAVEVLRRAAEMWPRSGLPRYMLCHARAAQGDLDSARIILDKLLETAKTNYVKPYFIAMCYVAVGDRDNAFAWFERAVDEGNEWMIWFGTEPKLDGIRDDPRYSALLQRTNNPIESKTEQTPSTGERERSIAVLPFRIVGSQNTADYLSIGLADALTMRLSNVRRFLVRPTSSVLPFQSKQADPFEAGRELGVEFIIDGIIRQLGDRIRVTAQLLNVKESSTRWSASFSELFTDVLELEDSISEQVATSLLPYLSGEERQLLAKRGTNSPEAFDAYLQGRYFWNQFTPASFPKAIAAFRKALEYDPNYAMAHVGVADYYTWACIYGLMPPSEGFPKVRESAETALRIDDSLSEGHAAMGLYHSNMQEWEASEASYRRSVELNPNYPLAHEWLSAILVGTGRFEEGTREILLAEQLDPLSLRPKVLSAWTIYQTGDFPAALAKARELLRLSSEFMQSYLQLANILYELGEIDEALENARMAAALARESPLPIYILCFALAAAGKKAEAEGVIAEWEKRAETVYVPPYFIGMCHLAVGNIDAAWDYLEKARIEKSAWALWFGSEPKMRSIRRDPRYLELVRATGNPIIEQLEKG
ncbi:MAG: tetratricopeptide repeat protein, partial [Saprospiraceae bacterium]|nr:tetratricopeptide repeat protein [Pyrinomonadaceae bacterium]